MIRQQGGNCDNPTPFQFTRAFCKLFVDNYLTPLSTGNCADDLDAYLIGSHPTKPNSSEDMPSSDQTSPPHMETVDDTDYKLNEIEQNLVCKNALTYVSGYLLKKCLSKHSCNICYCNFVTKNINDSSQLFCLFKTFEGMEQSGGLTIPQDIFVNYISSMENIFVKELNSCIERAKIANYICSQMPKLSKSGQCQNFPGTYLIQLFVKMRLHYALKFGNQELSPSKKKSRKYMKVQHL